MCSKFWHSNDKRFIQMHFPCLVVFSVSHSPLSLSFSLSVKFLLAAATKTLNDNSSGENCGYVERHLCSIDIVLWVLSLSLSHTHTHIQTFERQSPDHPLTVFLHENITWFLQMSSYKWTTYTLKSGFSDGHLADHIRPAGVVFLTSFLSYLNKILNKPITTEYLRPTRRLNIFEFETPALNLSIFSIVLKTETHIRNGKKWCIIPAKQKGFNGVKEIWLQKIPNKFLFCLKQHYILNGVCNLNKE